MTLSTQNNLLTYKRGNIKKTYPHLHQRPKHFELQRKIKNAKEYVLYHIENM